MDRQQVTVGYWVSDKKKSKMKFDRFDEICRASGVNVVSLDLTRPLEDQGPFDIILHKIGDDMIVTAENGDSQSKQQLDNLQSFLDSHPEVEVVDPLEKTMPLRDRRTMFKMLQTSNIVQTDNDVFVPPYVEVTSLLHLDGDNSLREAGITFPCVCKPSDARNPETSHDMSLVLNKEGLRDIVTPCVIQKFVNHSGVLYKVFMVGEEMFLVKRPSIKNLKPGNFPMVYFNTKEVSKANSASHLNESRCLDGSPDVVDETMMRRIGLCVKENLGIELLGIDVIIEEATGRYGLIDINPFPGYDGVANIHDHLLDLLMKRVQARDAKRQHHQNHLQNHHQTNSRTFFEDITSS